MTITPVELNHIRLKRGLLGYRRGPVDELILEIADSFEEVWRQRADYADKIEQLEGELSRHRDLESLLRTTLVSAEKSAHELKDQAKREAELVVGEAHAEAREVTRAAAAERERLLADARKVRALLAAALDAVEDAEGDAQAARPRVPEPILGRSERGPRSRPFPRPAARGAQARLGRARVPAAGEPGPARRRARGD